VLGAGKVRPTGFRLALSRFTPGVGDLPEPASGPGYSGDFTGKRAFGFVSAYLCKTFLLIYISPPSIK